MTNKTDAFEVEGLIQQKKKLDELMMTDPDMEKKVKKIIRKVLFKVQQALQEHASEAIEGIDLRKAYKAVKYTVYRQVLGGSVSLLNRRKAGEKKEIVPPRNPSHRGGNRRKRSQRTIDLQSYYGADRAFILRFINNGTGNRAIKFKPNEKRKANKWTENPNTGNRKSISARNFFDGDVQMKKAAEQLSMLIEDLIKTEFDK